MLKIIKHRINSINDLDSVDPQWGCEIDFRSNLQVPGELHLSHDPWKKGDLFSDWIQKYKEKGIKGPLILNTKEDGLEESIQNILTKHDIQNYFFLDTAFPTLVRHSFKNNEARFALRLSAFEKPANLKEFAGKVKWLWIDCFDGKPHGLAELTQWKEMFKICLVSPELQGQPIESIQNFKDFRPHLDAVCTKRPDQWQ